MLTKAAYLFGPAEFSPGRLVPRWLWLRALGLIFLSAFYALAFQIHGLIGKRGILPAAGYLTDVAHVAPGLERFWLIPSLFWIRAGDTALTVVIAAGIICSLLLVANIWPRVSLALHRDVVAPSTGWSILGSADADAGRARDVATTAVTAQYRLPDRIGTGSGTSPNAL